MVLNPKEQRPDSISVLPANRGSAFVSAIEVVPYALGDQQAVDVHIGHGNLWLYARSCTESPCLFDQLSCSSADICHPPTRRTARCSSVAAQWRRRAC